MDSLSEICGLLKRGGPVFPNHVLSLVKFPFVKYPYNFFEHTKITIQARLNPININDMAMASGRSEKYGVRPIKTNGRNTILPAIIESDSEDSKQIIFRKPDNSTCTVSSLMFNYLYNTKLCGTMESCLRFVVYLF